MNFSFATSPDIRFGRGASRDAADLIAALSDRVLLVHGRTPDRAAWLLDALRALGLTVETVACPGEPDIALVEAAVATARDLAPGVVVALGGGAAIDLGKAVAGLSRTKGPTLSYLEVVGEGRPLDAAPVPMIAIPTTAGTGAEVTKNAVIGVPEAGRKVSLRHPDMIPDIAIVDPALTDGAPGHVTFSSGFDAITQVIEPYLSTKASPLTDALCRDAIPRGLRAILALSRGESPEARDDMALTSLFGGLALANAGLGAVHGLAGVIGGRTGAAHGEICASLLPHVLDYDIAAVPAGSEAARRVGDVTDWLGAALQVPPHHAPETLRDVMQGLGIRGLSALGLEETDIEATASAARNASSSRSNPIPPADVDFEKILRRAMS